MNGGHQKYGDPSMLRAHLVDHMAFGVPEFVPHVPADLHKLFQDCAAAALTFVREPGGMMKIAVNLPIVFII